MNGSIPYSSICSFPSRPKHLFHFELDRKSVGIPSSLTRNILALHGLITRDHILDGTCLYMTDMRLAVGCWRSIIKGVSLSLFSILHGFLENVIVTPEFLCGFFSLNKVEFRVELSCT